MHERPYERMIVWREAYALCLVIYRLTRRFPTDERFGLISQMRRSSSGVPINIAEGNSKRTYPDKIRFFDIAAASLEELHCESRLSKDLTYLSEKDFLELDRRIQRVSYLLMKLRESFSS